MDTESRAFVWRRAGNCCEYCRLPHDNSGIVGFHIEHIYAKKHGGSDELQNLCLSCAHCNWAKGTDLSGLLDGKIVPLFHPRRQTWGRHFR
jgi:5-methylcytosine-specific restriction endonuclease McrA